MDVENGLESLMVRYQEGDHAAAAALVDRLSPQLYRFFLAQVVSRNFADDLLQETWLRIHQVRHTYRPGRPVLPWLYAIARNVRVDLYRKAQRTQLRERSLEESAEVAGSDPAPLPESRLRAVLAGLPESQREVLLMMKVSGMSLEEVARATSASVGSVKQKAHRAYETLRERLGTMGVGRRSQEGSA